MMTKLAHMRENRKNNKGFSLVELIIVIAIMVALIAVMGPQYVKYIQKSRDSALASAAEDFESYIKSAVSDPDTNLRAKTSDVKITLKVVNKKLVITSEGGTLEGATLDQICTECGVTTSSTAMGATDNEYTITLTSGSQPTVKMVGATVAK